MFVPRDDSVVRRSHNNGSTWIFICFWSPNIISQVYKALLRGETITVSIWSILLIRDLIFWAYFLPDSVKGISHPEVRFDLVGYDLI